MTYREWIDGILDGDLICYSYRDKLSRCYGKKAIIDLLFDSNGAFWFIDLKENGKGLPNDTFLREFGNYLNGKYVGEYHNHRGNGYTSVWYCDFSDDKPLDIQTTQSVFISSNLAVRVRENDYVKIIVDSKTDITIQIPESSRCIVEYWDGAKVKIEGNSKGVEMIKK